MPANLERVPGHDRLQETVTTAGLTAISAVPVLGGPVATAVTGFLAERQAHRQHEFNVYVAQGLDQIVERVDGLTPEAILESNEFMAAYEKASRAAAESASDDKRQRLANVVANMGVWSGFPEAQRTQLLNLVVEYDDLHVFLIRFFTDPAAWLRTNVPEARSENVIPSSISHVLGEWVFTDQPNWRVIVEPALAKLKSDGLLDVPLFVSMTGAGAIEPRTTPFAQTFIKFVTEEDS